VFRARKEREGGKESGAGPPDEEGVTAAEFPPATKTDRKEEREGGGERASFEGKTSRSLGGGKKKREGSPCSQKLRFCLKRKGGGGKTNGKPQQENHLPTEKRAGGGSLWLEAEDGGKGGKGSRNGI